MVFIATPSSLLVSSITFPISFARKLMLLLAWVANKSTQSTTTLPRQRNMYCISSVINGATKVSNSHTTKGIA